MNFITYADEVHLAAKVLRSRTLVGIRPRHPRQHFICPHCRMSGERVSFPNRTVFRQHPLSHQPEGGYDQRER